MRIKTLLCLLATTLFLQLSLTACNTVKGAGQDMQAAGGAIEKKAEQKKSY
jgi:predicted small secreted protein